MSPPGTGGHPGPRDSPYKGLVPYSEEDWPFFFGRSAEIRVIASNLRATRLTLLYGPSGVGKSSVLRAGVVHHLEEIAAADEALTARLGPVAGDAELARRELAVAVFRSWRDPPLVPLMEAIRRSARGAPGHADLPAWFPGTSVVDTLRGWTESVRTLLVILDQFEDYFLYHPEGAPDGGFADELARIVTTPDLRVNVLLSIREDALAKVDRFKGRIPGLYENYLRIEHLGPAEAREAITAPLQEHNRRLPEGAPPVEIEDGLIGAVLGAGELRAGEATIDRRAMTQPAAPAPAGERYETSFLQLVMSRLWAVETGQGSSVLRLATLRGLGGPQAIIQGHLETAMDALSDDERRIAAAMFGYLVTPSKTKIAHTASDLAAWSQVPEAEAEAVLQRLCGGDRILRAVEPQQSTGGPSPRRYEIFHDVLADAILDWRTRYEERAREAGRLAAAKEAADREHRRVVRARIVAASVGLLALVFAVLAVLAVKARNDARDQREVSRSISLAARASEVFASDPELSLLLALRASDAADTPQADQALRQATNDVRLRTLIPAGDGGAVVRAAVFSPTGDRLVTGGDDGRVIAWDPRTGDEQAVLVGSGPRLNDIVLSPDGALVATADVRGAVRVRDAGDGRPLGELTADTTPVNAVAFGPGGRVVASAGASGLVYLWDWRAGRVIHRLGEAEGPKVWRVAFSPDGTTVAAASDDGRVRLWDARTGAPRPLEARPHTGPAYAVAFSPDGRRLASGGEDGTVRVYELPGGRVTRVFRYQRGFVTDVSFSRGSRLLASAGLDGTIVVQDVDAGRALATLAGHRGSVRRASFSPDRLQVASAGADGTARVWDWGGNAIPIPAHGGPARSVALSPGSGTTVTLGADPTDEGDRAVAKTWDGTAGGIGQQAQGATTVDDPLGAANQGGVAFVGDDAIAIGAGTTAQVVGRDDPAAVTPLLLQRRALVSAVAASPDGATIVTTTVDGHVLLWRWPGGEPQGEIPGGGEAAGTGRTRAVFSPDGASLVTGDARGNLRVWDLATRRMLREAALAGRFIVDVAVSPDGRLIAAATDEGVVRLRDARTLEEVRTLVGHRGPVAAVAFGTLDGRTIVATGGSDGAVRVWDAVSGAALVTFQGQQGVVRDVAVAADGGTVASVADDGTLVFWPCEVCGSIDEVRRTAEDRVTRRLTPLEEGLYLRGG